MRRRGFYFLAAIGVSALFWARLAQSTGYAPDAAKSAARLSEGQREERGFIRIAAADSRFLADASRLALTKSANPGVRALAADLLKKYNDTSAELTYLLHVRGMALPMLENAQRKILNRLVKLSGTRFDREYMEQVGLKYQRYDLQQYERASLVVADPTLKAWIDRQLPTLRYQLTMAEMVAVPGIKATPPVTAAAPVMKARALPVNLSGPNTR